MSVRIQRKRSKGFNLQNYSKSLNGLECIIVSRPSKWGNPFKLDGCRSHSEATEQFEDCVLNNAMVYRYFDDLDEAKINFEHFKYISENIELLRGKNLSCWCWILFPCHADVLLELANK